MNPVLPRISPILISFSIVKDISDKEWKTLNDFLKLRMTLMALNYGKDGDYIVENLEHIFIPIDTEVSDLSEFNNFINEVFVYVIRQVDLQNENIFSILNEISNPLKEIVMTTYQYIIEAGKEEGKVEGIAIGEKREKQNREKAILKMIKLDYSNEMIKEVFEVTDKFLDTLRKQS